MRSLWVVLVAGAGCNVSVSGEPPVSLRIAPPSIVLDVDLALPAPSAQLQIFAAYPSGTEIDVTADATIAIEGPQLGAFTAGTIVSDGLTGGTAIANVTYDQIAAVIPLTANVHERRIIAGTATGAAEAFASATPMAFDAHVDPADGVILPPNLGRMVVDFAAGDLDDTHQITVTAPYLDLEIVEPGVVGPRQLELSADEWSAIVHTATTTAFELEVASLQSSAPATARVTTSTLELTDLPASALLLGGTTGDITDAAAIRPTLWRYDMKAGAATQAYNNPPGACIACHLAVSADGSRYAAVMIDSTPATFKGVLIGSDGTLRAQSDPTAAPWASAAFDPSGKLLASYQGYLSLRDADSGAMIAPIAMPETASAPTISPDGSALAYVTLDAGFGDAATQVVGNALYVRPFDAATATVGPYVELFRGSAGVELPTFSPDGKWVAYGELTNDPAHLNEVPIATAAVRADGSGTTVQLTADPLDQLASWASQIAPGRVGGRAPEPMVWIAINSTRPVGGNATSPTQIWLEAFYPDRGVITPAFHLPGQPATLKVLHGPIGLPK